MPWLADIDVVGVIPWTSPVQVHVASTVARPACPDCGTTARVKQTMRRRLVDLPSFGRRVVTVWRQVRWRHSQRRLRDRVVDADR